MALNARQKKYCRLRAEGMPKGKAYKAAGFSSPEAAMGTARNKAARLEHEYACSAEVRAEIERLRQQAEEGAILKRAERQALLTKIALNPDNDMPDRLRSLDQLNRMSGDYTDTVRTQVSGKIDMTFEEKLALIQSDMENETS